MKYSHRQRIVDMISDRDDEVMTSSDFLFLTRAATIPRYDVKSWLFSADFLVLNLLKSFQVCVRFRVLNSHIYLSATLPGLTKASSARLPDLLLPVGAQNLQPDLP